jgi:nicotinate-nucleotide pyrophosphorylase (carboxylating)
MPELPDIITLPAVDQMIDAALAEDIRAGDATTLALVDPAAMITASMIAREACVVSGGAVARAVFTKVCEDLNVTQTVADGESAAAGSVIMEIAGPAQGILTAERTALNFMQRMSGIATLTHSFVEQTRPYNTQILDTRKTTPGLRAFEKYAVLCGGGTNHRMGLYDRIMIKDNHRRLWRDGDPAALDAAIEACRKQFPALAVEVEVENETELRSALKATPEWILLDNMSPAEMAACVKIVAGRSLTEASGGITLLTAAAAAAAGVDAISLGCLTHSAPSVDLSLEILGL